MIYQAIAMGSQCHGGVVAGQAHSESWEEYVRDLGHELQRLRVAAGLSQEGLAYRAGLLGPAILGRTPCYVGQSAGNKPI